jgi:hypothetical protein
MAASGHHATMQDVTGALMRARQFMEHRKAAVEEDVGEFGFSATANVALVAHRMAAHAPAPAPAPFVAAGDFTHVRDTFAQLRGSPEEPAEVAPPPPPAPQSAYYSAAASPVAPAPSGVYAPSFAASYSGAPGTPSGGLGQRSRQLRAMRGFAPAERSPERSVAGSAYGAQSFAGFAPATPGEASVSSPPGDLRSRAQRLRESKSSASVSVGGFSGFGTPGGVTAAAESPYAAPFGGSSVVGGSTAASGVRAISPWRGGASPSRFHGDNVAESQSVRMRAYSLLQQKKGMGGGGSVAASGFGTDTGNDSNGGTGYRAFSPARPEAQSPAPSRRSSVGGRSAVSVASAAPVPAPAPAPATTTRSASAVPSARHAAKGLDVETQKLAAELRALFMRKRVDLLEAFSQFDKDGNHSIDTDEFRQGLLGLNLGLTDTQVSALQRAIDTDGNGQVDYFEFAEQFGMRRAQAAKQLLHKKAKDRDAVADSERAAGTRKSTGRVSRRGGKDDTDAFLAKLRTMSSQTPEPRQRAERAEATTPVATVAAASTATARDRRGSTASSRSRSRSRQPTSDGPSTPPPAAAAAADATGPPKRKSMAEKAALLAAAREETSGGGRANSAARERIRTSSPTPTAASAAASSSSRADALLERSRAQRSTTPAKAPTAAPAAAASKTPEPQRPRSKSVLKERAQKMQEMREKKGGTRNPNPRPAAK